MVQQNLFEPETCFGNALLSHLHFFRERFFLVYFRTGPLSPFDIGNGELYISPREVGSVYSSYPYFRGLQSNEHKAGAEALTTSWIPFRTKLTP